MKPLDEIPDTLRQSLRGIFSDIDETITTNGVLGAEAYSAIENISKRGIAFIPITGRPAGWCDMIARFWPVKGVIGENGAFFFFMIGKKEDDKEISKMKKRGQKALKKLEKIKQTVLKSPRMCCFQRSISRISDLAIDFCEDVPELSIEAVKKIKEIFVNSGATAKISSIHVNARLVITANWR